MAAVADVDRRDGLWSAEFRGDEFTLARVHTTLSGEELLRYQAGGFVLEVVASRLRYVGNEMRAAWAESESWTVPMVGLNTNYPNRRSWADLSAAEQRKAKADIARALARHVSDEYPRPTPAIRFTSPMPDEAVANILAARSAGTGIRRDPRSGNIVGPDFLIVRMQHQMGLPPHDVFSYSTKPDSGRPYFQLNVVAERFAYARDGQKHTWIDTHEYRIRIIGQEEYGQRRIDPATLPAAERKRVQADIERGLLFAVSHFYHGPPRRVAFEPLALPEEGKIHFDRARREMRGPGFRVKHLWPNGAPVPLDLAIYEDDEIRFNFLVERRALPPPGSSDRWIDTRHSRIRAIGLIDRNSTAELRLTAAQRERALANIVAALGVEISPYHAESAIEVSVDLWTDPGAASPAWDPLRREVRGPDFAFRQLTFAGGRDEDEERPDDFIYEDSAVRVFFSAIRYYYDRASRRRVYTNTYRVTKIGGIDFWGCERRYDRADTLTGAQKKAVMENLRVGFAGYNGSIEGAEFGADIWNHPTFSTPRLQSPSSSPPMRRTREGFWQLLWRLFTQR